MFAKPTLLSAARRRSAGFSGRFAVRRERRRLEHDISTYRTPAELLELEAILARHSAEDTRAIKAILARNAAPSQRSAGVR